MKQMLIKAIIPQVVLQIGSFAESILDYPYKSPSQYFKAFAFENNTL